MTGIESVDEVVGCRGFEDWLDDDPAALLVVCAGGEEEDQRVTGILLEDDPPEVVAAPEEVGGRDEELWLPLLDADEDDVVTGRLALGRDDVVPGIELDVLTLLEEL